MSRKKKPKAKDDAKPALRSTLHQILATRKSGKHKPDSQKRTAQKLRREIEES